MKEIYSALLLQQQHQPVGQISENDHVKFCTPWGNAKNLQWYNDPQRRIIDAKYMIVDTASRTMSHYIIHNTQSRLAMELYSNSITTE
jgi:hypothetical protein